MIEVVRRQRRRHEFAWWEEAALALSAWLSVVLCDFRPECPKLCETPHAGVRLYLSGESDRDPALRVAADGEGFEDKRGP